MMRIPRAIPFLLFIAAPALPAAAERPSPSIRLDQVWSIETGLASPESVAHDADRDLLYISNVNGYEKNGRGYLSNSRPWR